jgi:hypothetical protein
LVRTLEALKWDDIVVRILRQDRATRTTDMMSRKNHFEVVGISFQGRRDVIFSKWKTGSTTTFQRSVAPRDVVEGESSEQKPIVAT